MFPAAQTDEQGVSQAILAQLAGEMATVPQPMLEEEVTYDPPINVGKRRLSADDLESLGKQIKQMIEDGRDARSQRDMRVRKWRRQWDMVPTRRRSGPWKGSANYHSPLTRYTGETIAARIKHVTLTPDPYISVRPGRMDPQENQNARDIENFVQSQLTEDIDFADTMDTAVDMAVRDGFVVLQPFWRYEIRKERDKRPLDVDLLAELGYQYTPEQQFVNGQLLFSEGGRDFRYGDEVDVEDEVVTRNCIGIRVIDYMDFVVYPATARSVESAVLVGHRMRLSMHQLDYMVKDGLVDKEQLAKLKAKKPPIVNHGNERQVGDPDPDMLEGIGVDSKETLERFGLLEVYEGVFPYDHDNDGYVEDCLFRIELATGTLLAFGMWPYWRRERNYVPIVPFKRPRRLYGYAMGEVLEDLQLQDNVTMNQSVDVATLNLMPIIKEKATSRFKWASRTLELGKVQIVQDMDDFKIEQFNLPNQQVVADRARILDMAERLSAANESSQGVPSRGANTLGEIQQATEQGAIRLNVVIGRVQRAVSEIGRWIISLNRQFLDAETEFALTRRTGARLFGTITKQQLRTRISVKAKGNVLNTDQVRRMQAAEQLILFAERSPFMQGDLRKLYKAHEFFLSEYVDEPEFFLGSYKDAEAKQEELDNTPAQTEFPSLSGKLEPTVALAVLLFQHPEMEETLNKVVMMQARAEMQAAQEAAEQGLAGALLGGSGGLAGRGQPPAGGGNGRPGNGGSGPSLPGGSTAAPGAGGRSGASGGAAIPPKRSPAVGGVA